MTLFSSEFRPILIILVPLIASIVNGILGKRVSRIIVAGIDSVAAILSMIPIVLSVPFAVNGDELEYTLFSSSSMNLTFSIDGVGIIFTAISAIMVLMLSIYSFGLAREQYGDDILRPKGNLSLVLMGLLGAGLSADLRTLLLFFEFLIITLVVRMIRRDDGVEAPEKRTFTVWTLTSGVSFIVAAFYMESMSEQSAFVVGGFMEEGSIGLVLLLLLPGMIFTMMMPLHRWLRAVDGSLEPRNVQLLLAMPLLGILTLIRSIYYVLGPEVAEAYYGMTILRWLSMLTIVIAMVFAVRKESLANRLIYLWEMQVQFIVLGLAIDSTFSLAGAIIQIPSTIISMVTLLLCAGAVRVTSGKSNIHEMLGITRSMPETWFFFVIASLGAIGFPLFSGFYGFSQMVTGAISRGETLAMAVLLIGSLCVMGSLVPVILIAFKKDFYNTEYKTKHEANRWILLSILLGVIITVVLGIAPNAGMHMVEMAESVGYAVYNTLGAGI